LHTHGDTRRSYKLQLEDYSYIRAPLKATILFVLL
jgi:hypothetical protein